jgi:hypothetical protein
MDAEQKLKLFYKLFPKGCWIAFDDKKDISVTASLILEEAVGNSDSGKPVENPCYGCKALPPECKVRRIKYHQEDGRYIDLR